jgi:hypothetical protein
MVALVINAIPNAVIAEMRGILARGPALVFA